MRYPHKITLQFNTFNEFGEEVEFSTTSLDCAVTEQRRGQGGAPVKVRLYDLQVLIPAKCAQAYKEVLTDDTTRYLFDGATYRPVLVSAIRDMAGRTRHYQVELREVS